MASDQWPRALLTDTLIGQTAKMDVSERWSFTTISGDPNDFTAVINLARVCCIREAENPGVQRGNLGKA